MEYSDRNCRKLLEDLPEAVFLETLKGSIIDVNGQACKLLGYSREELLEMEVDDLVPKEAPTFLPDKVDEATRAGESLETINVDSRGNNIPVELRGRTVKLDGKERILVSVRKIEERKEREEQLELYKMAVEGSNDLMAACDQDYHYLFANQAYKDFYEVEEDIRDYRVGDLVGTEKFNNTVKARVDKSLQGERMEYEMTRIHPRGEERELKVIYYPLKVNDRIHGIVAVLRDVTEVKSVKRELEEVNVRLRKSKKRYRRYFEELGDAVFITKVGEENHGSIQDANGV
ncbi:MAG: PAS domain-containing protein [Candidatus Bipolaricaulota bacterium]